MIPKSFFRYSHSQKPLVVPNRVKRKAPSIFLRPGTLADRAEFLSREEERELIARWQKFSDEKSLLQLIASYYKLIVKIAVQHRRICGRCALEDFVSVGIVGFIKGLKKYELKRNISLSTYIHFWIFAEMQVFTQENAFVLRVPVRGGRRAKCHALLPRVKKKMGIQYIQNEAEARLAGEMVGVTLSPEEIMRTDQFLYMVQRSASLDDTIDSSEETTNHVKRFHREIQDERETPEEELGNKEERKFFKDAIGRAVEALKDAREKDIFISRYLRDPPITLRALGRSHSISSERVRQIEGSAFAKVKKSLLLNKKLPAVV